MCAVFLNKYEVDINDKRLFDYRQSTNLLLEINIIINNENKT